MYRFGDGTPFPLDENFLDTLSAVIEACTTIFGAAADLDARREKALEGKREAEEELRRLALMEKTVEQALFPMKPSAAKVATASQQTAHRVLGMAHQQVTAAKRELQQLIQQLSTEPRSEGAVEQVRDACAHLFETHVLPNSTWSMRWEAPGAGAHAEATALSGRFRTLFDVALDPPWNGAVRINTLVPRLRVGLPRHRMFGEPRLGRVSLEKCWLVGFEESPDRFVLVVRTKAGKPAPGWRIVLADPQHTGVVVTPIDADGHNVGNAAVAEGEDASALLGLGEVASGELLVLCDSKRRLRELRLNDTSLAQLTDPSLVGQTLMAQVSPLIKQIRAKSRQPGELVLKRDIGDGRREELFIPRSAIERRFSALPPEYRRFFEEAGLYREATSGDSEDTNVETVPAPRNALVTAPTVTLPAAPSRPAA